MDDVFFDSTGIEPLSAADFGPLPAGDYEVMIVASQMKPTKAGTGAYLELKCQVMRGEYSGRFLWSRLNLKNSNPIAVEIAKRELSAICHAVGVLKPKSKEELHNIPLMVHVTKRPDGRGGETNEIRGWGDAKKTSATASVSTATHTTTTAGACPW